MLCSNCGSSIKPESQFCPSCGLRIKSEEKGNPKNNQKSSKPAGNTSRLNSSLKLFMFIGLAAAAGISYFAFFHEQSPQGPEIAILHKALAPSSKAPKPPTSTKQEINSELADPVRDQLDAFKKNDTSKAYNEASKQFKATTTQANFERFVKATPILTKYSSYSVIETIIQEQSGFVLVAIYDEKNVEYYLEYTLSKEDNKWKIQGMYLEPSDNTNPNNPSLAYNKIADNESFSREEIMINKGNSAPKNAEWTKIRTVIEGQLAALRSKDYKKAFYQYTTKDFQSSNTLDKYEENVDKYPLLTQHTNVDYDYTQILITDSHATAFVVLRDKENSIALTYSLIKSGGEWKIWSSDIANFDHSKNDPDPQTEDQNVIKTIQSQLQNIKNKDLDKAYDAVSQQFQTKTSRTTFEQFVNNHPILTDYRKVSFGEVDFHDDKANVMAVLQNTEISNPVEYTLQKVDGQWKIFGFRLLSPEELQALTSADKGDLLALIGQQLAALRLENIERAYHMTSKGFQQSTSLNEFRDFVKQYDIFKENKTTAYSDIKHDHNLVSITTTLNSSKGFADVEYNFIKEDGQWKILNINVIRNENIAQKPASIKSTDLLNVIQGQLEAIKQHDLSKAYRDYTSADFKETTTLPDFESFIEKNPVVGQNKGTNFNHLSFENDVGTFEGYLTSVEGDTEPVKYRLVFEDNNWKILSINVLYSLQGSPKPLQITKIIVGTEARQDGIVVNPTSVLSADQNQNKITTNVYVKNGTKDSKLDVVLEHLDSNSRVAPVSVALDKDGDSIVSFIFTPPSSGWPKGNYAMHITSSTGVASDYNFKVE